MANNQSVFLDANILLEILLARDNNAKAREYVKKYAGSIHISALTAHLVVHFGQAIVALPVLRSFLNDYYIEPLTAQDFEWAFTNARSLDYEDALQLAVAIRTGSDIFATFDKNLHSTYKDLPTIAVKLVA